MKPHLALFFILVFAMSVLLIAQPAAAGVGGGGIGSSGCCDCWGRVVTVVCVDGFGCTTEVSWDWIDCNPPPGGGGGSGGGTGGGGGAGGSGSGGGAGTDPRDVTDEQISESAMCEADNTLITRHCNPADPQNSACCFQNSDDGHLCTTCDCAHCCDVYWPCSSPWTQSACQMCQMDCYVGFSTSQANGTDDSDTCSILNLV